MLSYYLNLPKEQGNIDIDGNLCLSQAIMGTARRAFGPLQEYLENAIEAQKRKEEIKVRWKKVREDNLAELRLIGTLFEVRKETFVKVDTQILQKIKDGEKIGGMDIHRVCKILKEHQSIVLEPPPKDGEVLLFQNAPLKYTIEVTPKPSGVIVDENDSRYVVYRKSSTTGVHGTPIAPARISSFVDFENLIFANKSGGKLTITNRDGMTGTLANSNYVGHEVTSNGLNFRIETTNSGNKEKYRIELIEIEEKDKDEIAGESPFRHFFDDDMSVTDGVNEYDIIDGNEERNTIILRRKTDKRYWWPEGENLATSCKYLPVGETERGDSHVVKHASCRATQAH